MTFRSTKKFPLLLISVFAAALLASCNPKDAGSLVPGDYDGIISAHAGASTSQEFAEATLKKTSDHDFVIALKTQSARPRLLQFDIALTGKGLVVTSPTENIRLNMHVIGHECLETDNVDPWGRLCFSQTDVTLDVQHAQLKQGFTVSIDRTVKQNQPPKETPRAFTKNELLAQSINRSFLSKIEFQKVIQAKLTARLAALNLLPHASMNTVFAALSPTVLNFFKDAGDLAPFLFPSRWAKAAAAKSTYDAEFYAWLTTKADAGNTVEGLAYSIFSLRESAKALEDSKASITAIRDQIRNREGTGIVQIGSSDDVTTVVNSIEDAVTSTNRLLKDDFAAISEASGFFNPEAVADLVENESNVSVETPAPTDLKFLSRLALDRSYELKQSDSLVAAAEREKKGRFFNWLDPNGDQQGDLGFGFPTYIEIASSKIDELKMERQQQQAIILKKIEQAVNEANLAVEQHELAEKTLEIENRRVARITTNMNLGIAYTLADLVTALQGQVKQNLILVSTRYEYLMAWSKLNRLTFSGPYGDLARGKLLSPAFEADLNRVMP